MISIDEAIAHAREEAKYQNLKYDKCPTRMLYCCEMCFHNPKCNEVAEQCEQLAEYLEELKDYQDKNKMVVRVDVENMYSIKDKIEELSKYAERQYNKALDDFIHECDNYCGFYSGKNKNITREDILKIAEQLKEHK